MCNVVSILIFYDVEVLDIDRWYLFLGRRRLIVRFWSLRFLSGVFVRWKSG